MYRKDLNPVLLGQPCTIAELTRLLDESPKDVEQDLHHLLKTLKRMPYRSVIEPAKCRRCGFVFHHEKLRGHGRCPLCGSTWVSEPRSVSSNGDLCGPGCAPWGCFNVSLSLSISSCVMVILGYHLA